MLAPILITTAAAIIFFLGFFHLIYTFWGDKLRPRDRALEEGMKSDSPGITRQTTMWRAWVGFNASHSLGALLFGAIYGYLAIAHLGLFVASSYLSFVGLAMLGSLLVLARRYWFRAPFIGIAMATACYVAGLILA